MLSDKAWSDDDDSSKAGGSKDKAREDNTKERRGVINRVNRACNHCRRMKMRCIGAEDPPCKRCRNSGLECVMEKPGRSADNVGEDRIRSLESQVSSIQNTLTDLVTTLRAGMSSNTSQGSGSTPQVTTTPEFAPPGAMLQPNTMGMIPGSSPSNPFDPSGGAHYRSASVGSQPNPAFYLNDVGPSNFMTQRSPSAPDINLMGIQPYNMGSSSGQMLPPQSRPQDLQAIAYANMANPGATIGGGGGGNNNSTRNTSNTNPGNNAYLWPDINSANNNSNNNKHLSRHESLPPSRAGSEGNEDILGPEEIINPLGAMTSMAGLVEAAVERAREEQVGPTGIGGTKRTTKDNTTNDNRPIKKARFSPILPSGPTVLESQNLPPIAVPKKSKVKKTHIHAYPDVIAEGIVSETEGKELMAIFYAGSSNFIPCYDPSVDTWDSLRLRSPFSVTTIIMIGARVRDGGGPVSDIQKLCREHAQRIALGTLFNPVARVEAVQAMMLLAAFSEAGWLPGGHAVRMATDMGINRSFILLLRSGMGKGKSPQELEEERHLVVHSRVWFCLYLLEHQMAYGMGRPAILREDESIHQCRRLLEHPLSITSDARLVSTVELMALRAPLHIELTASPDLPIAENTLRRLKQANTDFDAWERYWDRILSDRFGKGRGDFFRESLIIQRQYAELFVNSQLLRGIREPTDVVDMTEEKRALAIRAMKNAQRCIEICLRGENYRNGLRYAVHYTHVCAAFAASFLIRIARLFPEELNLKKTAKDVEELANVLSEIPAGRYARSLRLILRKARRAKVIPAASIVSSPTRQAAQLPLTTAPASNLQPTPTKPQTPFSPSQLVNPAYYPTPTPGGVGPSSVSPNSLLQQAGNIINDSPASADIFEFDSLFAQETMEKAGIFLGEGDKLPLFLDGQSLGASQAPSEITPYVGMEQFFLPTDIDHMLGGPSAAGDFGNGNGGMDPPTFTNDVWW